MSVKKALRKEHSAAKNLIGAIQNEPGDLPQRICPPVEGLQMTEGLGDELLCLPP
jgi:hypothetical protein